MRLHRIRQDVSFDLIADFGVVLREFDSMFGLILSDLEVDYFEQDGNAGIESDVHEHSKGMDGIDPASHSGFPEAGSAPEAVPIRQC